MVQLQFTQANFEYLLLIFARIASFMFAAPFFSMANTPSRVRIGLSVFISILIYQVLPKESLAYSTVIEYAVLVLREVVVGLLIGLSANICGYIITFAGRMIDTEIGLSMVSLFDPISNEEVSITGSFYNYIFFMLFRDLPDIPTCCFCIGNFMIINSIRIIFLLYGSNITTPMIGIFNI